MGQELATIGETASPEPGPGRSVAKPAPMRTGDGKVRWRYELDPGTGEDDIPMLVQRVRLSSFRKIQSSIFHRHLAISRPRAFLVVTTGHKLAVAINLSHRKRAF